MCETEENCVQIAVGKSEGSRQLGESRCRWLHNIEMDFKVTVWESVEWINLAWCRDKCWAVLYMVMNVYVP
jgi:hypothetical protein